MILGNFLITEDTAPLALGIWRFCPHLVVKQNPKPQTLVDSGGVACDFFQAAGNPAARNPVLAFLHVPVPSHIFGEHISKDSNA